MRSIVATAFVLAACGTTTLGVQRGPGLTSSTSRRVRLGAVMWPTATSIIACTRRLDEQAQPVGVAGPCAKLEAGENNATKVLSWATLGRFDGSPPDGGPPSLGGRCHFEIEDAARIPQPRSAKVWWVTPTQRRELAAWTPADEKGVAESDQFTMEVTLAPEGEWMALLRVAIGLGDGERIVQVVGMNLLRVPACE